MNDLAQIARIPNVASAVLGDVTGVFHDAVREPDGESVAAVTGFISSSVGQAGDQLGLGGLGRIAVAGATRACIILVDGTSLVTIGVEPAATLPAVERALDSSFGVRG